MPSIALPLTSRAIMWARTRAARSRMSSTASACSRNASAFLTAYSTAGPMGVGSLSSTASLSHLTRRARPRHQALQAVAQPLPHGDQPRVVLCDLRAAQHRIDGAQALGDEALAAVPGRDA